VHVLWLVPDHYTFLVEELEALSPLVSRLSVISQAPSTTIAGATVSSIPRLRATIGARTHRVASFVRAWWDMGRSVRGEGLRSAWRVARQTAFLGPFVRRERVDVVHSHFGVPDGTGGTAGLGTVPVVMTLRGVDVFARPEIGYGLRLNGAYEENLKRSLGRAAVVTVASRAALTEVERLGRPAAAVTLIRNGLDVRRFCGQGARDDTRRALGLEGRRVIMAMGNFVPVKGYDLLIRAFRLVHAAVPSALLLLAGDGPEEGRLRALAEAEGIAAHVRFAGRIARAEVPRQLEACDVFAHPAVSEGFGNAIVEAMAMGRIVVTRRVGIAAEVIESGRNGILIEGSTEIELARALRAGLEASNAPIVGERARETVAGALSLEQRALAFRHCYDAAVAGALAPRPS
jgi:glycosyltransferase involved in cell wall biosynthesis